MEKYTIEMSKEEVNVVRNGIRLIILRNQKEETLSESAKYWYEKVCDKFDEIADQFTRTYKGS
jgi:hypothetical protein